MGWVEIPNGSSSYFYNEETKQSTYICPAELLVTKMEESKALAGPEKNARAQTLSTASRVGALSRSPVNEQAHKAEVKVAMDAWTVQVRDILLPHTL